MKKTRTWLDTNRNITNNIYELENGSKIVESINPGSVESYVSFIFPSGHILEDKLKLPKGTLHFLEHILAGNPNKIFTDKKSLDSYVMGSLNHPQIFTNAYTGVRYLRFVGYSHYKGLDRLIKYLSAKLDYPLDRISEFIEKERSIILTEILRKEKKEISPNMNFDKFFFGDLYPLVEEYGIGNEETIKNITVEDLVRCYKEVMTSDNLIITIQHPKKLSSKTFKQLEQVSNSLSNGKPFKFKPKNFTNSFKYKAFSKKDYNGVFVSINRFRPSTKDVDYKRSVLNFFYRKLIGEITYRDIREAKNLLYSWSSIIEPQSFDLLNYNFNAQVRLEKLEELLEELFNMFEFNIYKFLDSDDSDQWFESEKSLYIYQLNKNYNSEYAENIGCDISADFEPEFHFSESIKVAKDLKKEDLKKYFNEITSIQPGFWFVSESPDQEIEDIFKKSKFYKKYTS